MKYLFYWFLVHVIVFECRQRIGSCRPLPEPGSLFALPAGRGGLLSFGGHPATFVRSRHASVTPPKKSPESDFSSQQATLGIAAEINA